MPHFVFSWYFLIIRWITHCWPESYLSDVVSFLGHNRGHLSDLHQGSLNVLLPLTDGKFSSPGQGVVQFVHCIFSPLEQITNTCRDICRSCRYLAHWNFPLQVSILWCFLSELIFYYNGYKWFLNSSASSTFISCTWLSISKSPSFLFIHVISFHYGLGITFWMVLIHYFSAQMVSALARENPFRWAPTSLWHAPNIFLNTSFSGLTRCPRAILG